MTPTSDRDTAAELARRIKINQIDPAQIDDAQRPPEDRPPGFADALMSEKPASPDLKNLTGADWQLIGKALDHYSKCPNG